LFIPLFAIMVGVGLTNSLTGLSIAHMGFTIPFCTWLLMGFFISIPVEIEEAALIDGCSRIGVLFRIILPIALPALAVVAFFSFTLSWNEYLYAIVFNSDPNVRTIPTGLRSFIVEDVFFWGPIMGSTFLTAIPPLIVYFIFQRWLITGLTMGAVKG
jgi:multiple sugar transport system permease protein